MPKVSAAVSFENWRAYERQTLTPLQARALDTLVKYGYYGATVRLIAESASMTVPGLYYHYASKQAILADLVHASIDELLLRSEEALVEAGEDVVLAFAHQVENAVLFMTYRSKQRLLTARDGWELEEPSQGEYLEKRDTFERRFEKLIDRGREEGLFLAANEESVVRAVLDMCSGVAIWYRPDGAATPEEIAATYTRHALRLVGCERQPPTS